MSIASLLQQLGYEGAPSFLQRGDGRFESELGCGHIFRKARAEGWQAIGVYGIRESNSDSGRFTPLIYVCTAKDATAAQAMHRLLWNQDVAPYIMVYTDQGISVYSGFCYATSGSQSARGIVEELKNFNDAVEIVQRFHRDQIDSAALWQQPRYRIDASKRVYHQLLASLRELDKLLQNQGLAKATRHGLIGKFVYLRYLRDRGILSDERLQKWQLSAADVFSRQAKKASLEALSQHLDTWLNGEIFPLAWRGKDAPKAEHIRQVAGAFCGDQVGAETTQLHLEFQAYDFAFIPIETLSLVYEQFLHSDDAADAKGRSEGAYYTPLPLVNFVLAQLERQLPLRKGMKVFDPSSGSGTFLVQAYRLLIEKTFPANQRKAKPSELRDLLEQSIFGCDVDADACQVTQLSLLLTLLDYVDPPDLTGAMHSFKLPTLCKTTDSAKLKAGHTPNILQRNFFGVEAELASAVLRKPGAKAIWEKQGFDWIVGNPPWKPINPNRLGPNDGAVRDWIKTNEKTMPIGNYQAAQAFAWEAGCFLKQGGECALLVPAMGLFEELSIRFRATFFRRYQVHSVANFSNLAEVLFDGRARVPTAALNYRLRREQTAIEYDEITTVFSPFVVNQAATCPSTEGQRGKIWSLSTNSSEVSVLSYQQIAEGSGLPWKLAMWGTQDDARLLKRLAKKWPTLRGLENSKLDQIHAGVVVSQGLEMRDTNGPDVEEVPLQTRSILDIKKLNRFRTFFGFPGDAIVQLNNRAHFARKGRVALPMAVSIPPHIIVSAARTFAVYSDEFLIVPARQIGIASLTKDKDFLKALSLYLSSDFAFYHQFFLSTQFGIQRGRATLESLRKIPIPIAMLPRAELKPWVALHGELIRCEPRQLHQNRRTLGTVDMFDDHAVQEDRLDELLKQLNQMCAEALGLTGEERTLVSDFVHCRYALNDGKRGDAAMRKPTNDELRAYAETLKRELDEFVGESAGRRHRVCVFADTESAILEVEFTNQLACAKKVEVLTANQGESAVLSQTRASLLADHHASQWRFFNRNLRIYRGRSVYILKPLNRCHWTQSGALNDASQIIAETLSGAHD